jgi:predicted Zn finger-like uncharacterized protein
MQIACPSCGARYLVDPAAIGVTGRTVQCSRCSHRWFKTLDAPPPSEASPPQERPVPDFVIRPQAPGGGLPAVVPPREFPQWGKLVIGIAILILVFGGAAFAFKDDLLHMVPSNVRQTLGFEVKSNAEAVSSATPAVQQKRGRTSGVAPALTSAPAPAAPAEPGAIELAVDLSASKVEFVDGHYVIRGEIVNNGKAEASIHALKLLFKKDTTVLGERFYPLFSDPVRPGARQAFSQILDDPPAGTTDIVPTVE